MTGRAVEKTKDDISSKKEKEKTKGDKVNWLNLESNDATKCKIKFRGCKNRYFDDLVVFFV